MTFVYDFENYRTSILNSLLKLEALMFRKMAVFENQLLRRKFHRKLSNLDLFKSPSEKRHEFTIICLYERSEVQESERTD